MQISANEIEILGQMLNCSQGVVLGFMRSDFKVMEVGLMKFLLIFPKKNIFLNFVDLFSSSLNLLLTFTLVELFVFS